MSDHRYPWAALRGDYLRAGAGLLMTVGPLFTVPVSSVAGFVLAALAVLFGALALRTMGRQLTRYEATSAAVTRIGPSLPGLGRRTIAWRDLSHLKLRFYTTRRDREHGWMQLKLTGPAGGLSIDSTLHGFDDIARHAAAAARINRLALAPATASNFAALGLSVEREGDQGDSR